MPHAYADRETAVGTLTELLARDPPARALVLLDASTGTLDNTTVYRPHITAALTFAGEKNTRRVHEAEGVKFDAPVTTILSLLDEQAAWDVGVDVPEQWAVETVRARLVPKPGGWAAGTGTTSVAVVPTF